MTFFEAIEKKIDCISSYQKDVDEFPWYVNFEKGQIIKYYFNGERWIVDDLTVEEIMGSWYEVSDKELAEFEDQYVILIDGEALYVDGSPFVGSKTFCDHMLETCKKINQAKEVTVEPYE